MLQQMIVQEYNMISLPTDLETEDFVDIRLALPNGQDFIVLSKKSVTIPDLGGVPSTDTIRMELTEMETLYMGNAIIDSYLISGSRLYATKYSEAGLQLARNEEEAEEYSREIGNLRNMYINSLIQNDVTGSENVKSKVEESITSTQEARQQYLEAMGGTTTQ